MAVSKLEELKDLVHGLLECRKERKLVIVGLCDRGRDSLNKLVHLGPDLIRVLDDIGHQWISTSKAVPDSYLKPLRYPCYDETRGTFDKNLANSLKRSNDRSTPLTMSPEENPASSAYQKMVYQDDENLKEAASSPTYQALIVAEQHLQGQQHWSSAPRDSDSFSVLGLGTFPLQSHIPGMDGSDNTDSQEAHKRSVLGHESPNQLIQHLKRECDEKSRQFINLQEQVSPFKPQAETITELVIALQQVQFVKQQNEAELAELRKFNDDLTQRLAKEMSSKVSADESDLENVNIKNRPLNIATEYEALCSNTWLVAKNELDKYCRGVNEEEKLTLLRKILMTSERKAARCYKRLLERTELMLSQPLGHLQNMERIDSGFLPQSVSNNTVLQMVTSVTKKLAAAAVGGQMPTVLGNAIGDYLRREADKVDLKYLVQEVQKTLLGKTMKSLIPESRAYSNRAVHHYIEECSRLAWKLQLQRPPMKLDDQAGLNKCWREGQQEPYFLSKCVTGVEPIVKFYVHPALIHNTAILVKGRVYMESSQTAEGAST